MSKLQEIITTYKKLRDYCDGFWERVHEKYPDAFACAAGCSTCCELPSVNHLEALIITMALKDLKARPAPAGDTKRCPFLENDRCSIYASRPLICRTHGLLLKSEEYAYELTMSCPYNFPEIDLKDIDPSCVLAIDMVSNNLARLNAAYCLLKGDVKKAGDRVFMRDLASGKRAVV